MKTIGFSENYEKLPLQWEGSEAVLMAVVETTMSWLKKNVPKFLEWDTKFRGRDEYYHLNFDECLVLLFIHKESGCAFTTIRRAYSQKTAYYKRAVFETFLLKKVKQR